MIAVAMLFSYLATSYMVAANANVEIGVESGDWMKYNIISDERNFTGWQGRYLFG
jgi:hypothetical protein